MRDPHINESLIRTTRRLTARARALLMWERYAPVFALAVLVLGVFVIGSFSGIWERIGDPWRLSALLITIGFLGKALWAAHNRPLPTRSDAKRRVEADSGVRHRPLDTIEDRPAISGDGWPAHVARARQTAEKLGPPIGRPTLAPMDPYFVRFALPVGVGLAMMVGFGDNFERLKRSLTPTWQAGISASDAEFEVWADPPEYTGRPPMYFKSVDAVDIPQGSKLVARISGVKSAPRLKIVTPRGSRYVPLTRLGPESFEAVTEINQKSEARWRIGNDISSWTLNALPDRTPTVEIVSEPRADKRDRLALSYNFEDDYGVEELFLSLQLLTEDEDLAAQSSRVDIPLPSKSVRKAEDKSSALDLTKHKWAGKKVSARLFAKDGLGQAAGSQTVYFTVPDKIFVEPLAKAVIEQRGLVMAGDKEYGPLPRYSRSEWQDLPWFDTFDSANRLDRAPAPVQRAAVLIDAITDRPEGLYYDPAVFMGLKNVLGRLRYARSSADLSGIPEDLWSIAIRAEFGVLGTALQEMQEAEQALREAMARRAPQREIDTLFDRYNEAVDRYMEELRRNALEEGNIAQNQMGGGGGGGGSTDEIQELLDAIEEANRLGDTEAARLALARLAELLENMQIQLALGGGGGGGPSSDELSEEMKEALEDLADMLGEQRELMDETERAETEQSESGEMSEGGGASGQSPSEGEPSEPGSGALSPSELAERQNAIQEALEGLQQSVENGESGFGTGTEDGEDGSGSMIDELAEAEGAMRDSEQALENGDLGASQDAQDEAISALRRAGEALSEELEARQAELGSGGSGEGDPLGRNGDNDENAEADLDTKDQRTRSRELLEELRRRASEQEREQIEREYLERLLDRF